MSVNYFEETIRFPKVMKSAIETSLLYTISILYYQEYKQKPENTLKKRLVLSDVNSGEDFTLQSAQDQISKLYNQYKIELPFTTYQIDTLEFRPEKNNQAHARPYNYFDTDLKRYIKAYPVKLTIPMISIFNKGDDYSKANLILLDNNASLHRLWAPVIVGGKQTATPVDVTYEITKGNYAFGFQEWLSKGKIYDINHNMIIIYYDLMVEDEEVAEVDNIILWFQPQIDFITNNGQNLENYEVSTTPLSITSPIIDNSNIDITEPLIINFSHPVEESSFYENFFIYPDIYVNFTWNIDFTQVTLVPDFPLNTNTDFTITINADISTDSLRLMKREPWILHFHTN